MEVYKANNNSNFLKITSIVSGIFGVGMGFLMRIIANNYTTLTHRGSANPILINGVAYAGAVVETPTQYYYIFKNIGLILIILGILLCVLFYLLSNKNKMSYIVVFQDKLELSNAKTHQILPLEQVKTITKKSANKVSVVADEVYEIDGLLDVDTLISNFESIKKVFNQ